MNYRCHEFWTKSELISKYVYQHFRYPQDADWQRIGEALTPNNPVYHHPDKLNVAHKLHHCHQSQAQSSCLVEKVSNRLQGSVYNIFNAGYSVLRLNFLK